MKQRSLLIVARIIIACFFALSLYFSISEMKSVNIHNIRSCEIKKTFLRSGRRSNSSVLVEYNCKDYFIGIPRSREDIFDSLRVGKRYNFYLDKNTDTLFVKDDDNYKLSIFIGFVFFLTFIPNFKRRL